ncbi:hypothetical protein T552_02315 [Pneumocystis carinii B80]|uniref:Tuberous sclerosis 1 n=1 Tax=Pneumocystis carinii (strain B80) TaxID=1408658 RepID=A0A0W4ZG58_PNEC8|nr:hypothetical protein T552_02315 [Pneumocystis carinii B80]KTW27332.1 hypothetical protein T552_02315 [Pneumocystis carinii B80]
MSNQSLSRLLKTLHNLFSSSEIPQKLPHEISDKISQYLKKHDNPDLFEVQKLQEQLLDLYRIGMERKSMFFHGLFICCLRKFKSLLIGKEYTETWWNIIVKHVFSSPQQQRDMLLDAESILLSIMVLEEGTKDRFYKEKQECSEMIKRFLFEFYLDHSKESFSSVLKKSFIEDERRYISANIESILISYAKQRTKAFFNDIDAYFVQKKYRLQVLTLLCAFVRLQGPYLYTIFETPLFENLLNCLENDSSTTVISLSLTILVMFMPHICNLLGKYLPRLFKIYVRVLCWDRYGAIQKHYDVLDNELETKNQEALQIFNQSNIEWEKLDSLFDISPTIPPNCLQFFTFIYGLYPLNFLKFLHSAQTYLKEKKDQYYMYFDDDVIRSRSESLIKRHIIHPNLLSFTFETEITDQTRWMKLEVADIVAKCVSFDIFNTPQLFSRNTDTQYKQDENNLSADNFKPAELETGKSKDSLFDRNQNHLMSHIFFSNPENIMSSHFDTNLNQSIAPVRIDDMLKRFEQLHSNSSVYSNSDILETGQKDISLNNLSPKSKESIVLKSETEKHVKDSASLPLFSKTVESDATVALLKREILLLQNELNFEKYLKLQHLHHLSRLKREYILDLSVEAERQNLYNTTRALKSRLVNLQTTLDRLRSEATTRQNQRIKRETELNTKLKLLREEQKCLKSDYDIMSEKLEESQKNISYLSIQLQHSNSERFKLNQELKELKAEQLKNKKMEVSSYDNSEQKKIQFEESFKEKDELLKNADKTIFVLNQKLQQKEHEYDIIKSQYNLLLIKSMDIPFHHIVNTEITDSNTFHEDCSSKLNNNISSEEFNLLENAHQKLLLDYRAIQSEMVSKNSQIEILQQKIAKYQSQNS